MIWPFARNVFLLDRVSGVREFNAVLSILSKVIRFSHGRLRADDSDFVKTENFVSGSIPPNHGGRAGCSEQKSLSLVFANVRARIMVKRKRDE
jgi:hypothetical protein